MEKQKLIFERLVAYKGYNIKAWDICGNKTETLIEIFKDNKVIRTFTYPSYKIYNLQAHFEDIINYEMWLKLPTCVRSQRFSNGYQMASWNGFY